MVRSFRQKENLTTLSSFLRILYIESFLALVPRGEGETNWTKQRFLSLSRILCRPLSQMHSLTPKRFFLSSLFLAFALLLET